MRPANLHRNRVTILLGVAFWITLLTWGVIASNRKGASDSGQAVSSRLKEYLVQSPHRFRIRTESLFVSANDPVFVRKETGSWQLVGYITGTRSDDSVATGRWYGKQDPGEYRFRYHRNHGTLDEALAVLIPPEKRSMIWEKLVHVTREHEEELFEAFQPIFSSLVQESAQIIAAEVADGLPEHREALARMGERYETEILEERLMPLVHSEVLPSVREHGTPLAKKIGYELWQRASVWRFGWRMAYDQLPLTNQDLTRKEWERFVEEEAVPIFEKRTDAMIEVVKRVLKEVGSNPTVRREIKDVVRDLLNDKQLQALVRKIFSEAIVDNARLHRVWREHWHSEQARTAFKLTLERYTPTLRDIGEEILGSRESGITPEFARTLRRHVFGKDRRWIIAEPRQAPLPDASLPRLRPGAGTGLYPLAHLAGQPTSPMAEVPR